MVMATSGSSVEDNPFCGNGNINNGICKDGRCCSIWGWCGNGDDWCDNRAPITGTCGGGDVGDGLCADGRCCSKWGWCGSGSDWCDNPPSTIKYCGNGKVGNGLCVGGECCSKWGWCGDGDAWCDNPPSIDYCGNGHVGAGVCNNGLCCSMWGWCGGGDAWCLNPPSRRRLETANGTTAAIETGVKDIADSSGALRAHRSPGGNSTAAATAAVSALGDATYVTVTSNGTAGGNDGW